MAHREVVAVKDVVLVLLTVAGAVLLSALLVVGCLVIVGRMVAGALRARRSPAGVPCRCGSCMDCVTRDVIAVAGPAHPDAVYALTPDESDAWDEIAADLESGGGAR